MCDDIEVRDRYVLVRSDGSQYLDVSQVNRLIERLEAARDAVVEKARQQADRRSAFLATLSQAGAALRAGKKIAAIADVHHAFTKLHPEGGGVSVWEAKSIVEAFAND
jgi:DNA-binding MarR family transcriptional regulator